MTTAERIKAFRQRKGWTQEELARAAGVGHNTIGLLERGKSQMSARVLKSVSSALGVSIRDLLTDREAWFFVKLDDLAYMPSRAHEDDAGFDLFAPTADLVPAHGSTVIDTGVHIAIPKGYAGLICSKSGLNVNHGIISDGLVDSGYTGSIRVKLYNLSRGSYLVTAGDKISQIVFIPIAEPALVKVDSLDPTERGEGGFGSTGR